MGDGSLQIRNCVMAEIEGVGLDTFDRIALRGLSFDQGGKCTAVFCGSIGF